MYLVFFVATFETDYTFLLLFVLFSESATSLLPMAASLQPANKKLIKYRSFHCDGVIIIRCAILQLGEQGLLDVFDLAPWHSALLTS